LADSRNLPCELQPARESVSCTSEAERVRGRLKTGNGWLISEICPTSCMMDA
jgi:hypothetical protein